MYHQLKWCGEYSKIATNTLKVEILQLLSNDNLICILTIMTLEVYICVCFPDTDTYCSKSTPVCNFSFLN